MTRGFFRGCVGLCHLQWILVNPLLPTLKIGEGGRLCPVKEERMDLSATSLSVQMKVLPTAWWRVVY